MKPDHLKKAVLITAGFVLISILLMMSEESNLRELEEQNKVLEQQVNEIDVLKSRWSTQESKNDLKYLLSHPNLVKQEKRGSNTYFEYDNLSAKDFNQLSNTLLNSSMVIKKLTLRRNGASKGTILVEIES